MGSDTIFLTGATGFIGQYLLSSLLAEGRQVAVLARAKHNRTAEDRVEHIVRAWEERLGTNLDRPVCFEGDIRREDCGLSFEEVSWLRRNASTMLHGAALVNFKSEGTRITDTNFAGTENCLELCRTARIGQLHYVSTAYVCGADSQSFSENQLECGQTFRNEYERSKYLAEKAVRKSAIPEQVTVYRPSIVVGDSQTGFTTSYRGFYVLAQFTQLIAQYAQRDSDGRWHHPIRFHKSADERRNLVPVDWVAKVIGKVIKTPHLHGQTYQIAPSIPVTAAEIEIAFRNYFSFYGVDLVEQNHLNGHHPSSMKEMFFNYIGRYMPYWNSDPHFDVTNTQAAMTGVDEPRVDVANVTRMIDFAVKDNFGRKARRRPMLMAS